MMKNKDVLYKVENEIGYHEYGNLVKIFRGNYIFIFIIRSLICLIIAYILYKYIAIVGIFFLIFAEFKNLYDLLTARDSEEKYYLSKYGETIKSSALIYSDHFIFNIDKIYEIYFNEVSRIIYTDKYIYIRSNKYNHNFIITNGNPEIAKFLKDKIKK